MLHRKRRVKGYLKLSALQFTVTWMGYNKMLILMSDIFVYITSHATTQYTHRSPE